MAFEIKFSKFDNTPWGFRLTGGNDYGMPLTVVKVSEGSLAESFGLIENDNIIQINEVETTSLTHDQAHEVILQAGNNFVATVYRNEQIPIATSCPNMTTINTTPLVNGVDQVPIYDAKVTSMIYKLYSDTDTTPLENPPIPLPKHVDEFQTINQQEWKKMSSKHIQSSSEFHHSSSNNQTCNKSIKTCNLNHIDLKEIEQSSTDNENAAVVDSVKEQSNIINTSNHVTVDKSNALNSKEVKKIVSNASNIEEVKNVHKESNNVKHEITDESITLEEAKIGAINAANFLSQSSKLNRKSSIEESKMDTIKALKTISQSTKHKCFAVPCEASKLQTKSQTDLLLKTFFIHLTDVMVALTQVIQSEDECKSCSCTCGPNCVCNSNKVNNESSIRQKVNISNEMQDKLNLDISSEKKVIQTNDNLEKKEISSKVETVLERQDEINKTNNTEVILKEVIQNIQTATGVDVTVNGKDPLEWLADLDEQQKNSSQCKLNKNIVGESVCVESKVESSSFEKKHQIDQNIQENVNIESQVIATLNQQQNTESKKHVESESISVENGIESYSIEKTSQINQNVQETIKNESEVIAALDQEQNTELKKHIENEYVSVENDVGSLLIEKNSQINQNVQKDIKIESEVIAAPDQQQITSQCELEKHIKSESMSVENKTESLSSVKTSQINQIDEKNIKYESEVTITEFKASNENIDKIQPLNEKPSIETNIEIKPSWDIKVIPTVPQTPNTEEYLFRLNVKLKGKLSDYPETNPELNEPIAKEEIITKAPPPPPPPKKPKFTLGDIKIERTVLKPIVVTNLDTETDSVNESAAKIVQETINIANEAVNKSTVDTSIKGNLCDIANNTTASTNVICVNASELTDNYNTDNINTPGLASANNSVNVEFTNNDNITCTNVETSKCYTNASISSIKNEASATNTSDSTLSSTYTSIVPDISSSICTFPASASGNVSTISATTNNHDSLNNCAIEQHGREHETSISQFKATNIIDEHNTCLTSTKETSMISEKIESVQLNNSNEEFSQTSSIVMEDVTVKSPPPVKTMGELSKCFSTIENGIQSINGNCIENGFNNMADVQTMDQDIGKPGLPDDEINQILSGCAQETKEQHVIGLQKVLASHMKRPDDEINSTEIKDMTPLVGFLKDSEVFKALNEESLKSKAEKLQEDRRKWTTFLQKPSRPIPFCKRTAEQFASDEAPYRVNIKKQPKRDSCTESTSNILTEGVFLIPEVPILIPEPSPEYYEAPEYLADSSFPDLEDTGIPIPIKSEEIKNDIKQDETECISTEPEHVEEIQNIISEESEPSLEMIINEEIDTSMSMEEQLMNVQRQLVALSKLPATIQQTLDEVTKQLSKMVPASERAIIEEISQTSSKPIEESENQNIVIEENNNVERDNEENSNVNPMDDQKIENGISNETETSVENENNDEQQIQENNTTTESNGIEIETETKSSINEKKCANIINEGQNIEKLKKDLISELNEEHIMRQVKQRPGGRVGRPQPAFGPLVPQERPIVLPGGRKWKGPRDALTDSFIAETLSGQAELIMGKALGVNFMKYAKPPKTLDHLKQSSVFKMVHDLDEPLHGIQDRASMVIAESEFREKCRSVTPNIFNGQEHNGGISVETES